MKITVGCSGRVVSHKIRTDPDFLSPLEIDFAAFVKEVHDKLKKSIEEHK